MCRKYLGVIGILLVRFLLVMPPTAPHDGWPATRSMNLATTVGQVPHPDEVLGLRTHRQESESVIVFQLPSFIKMYWKVSKWPL
jgi:hypothetical protein